MKKKLIFCIIGTVLAALLWGCHTDISYSEDHHFDRKGWSHTDTITFDIPHADSLTRVADVRLFIRNSNTYHYRNIYIGTSIVTPSGRTHNEVVHLQLADERGLWKGKGWTSLFTSEYTIKESFRFDQKGTYKVHITHRMRDDLLQGIEDIGICLKTPKGMAH